MFVQLTKSSAANPEVLSHFSAGLGIQQEVCFLQVLLLFSCRTWTQSSRFISFKILTRTSTVDPSCWLHSLKRDCVASSGSSSKFLTWLFVNPRRPASFAQLLYDLGFKSLPNSMITFPGRSRTSSLSATK